jgi:hypothetical protein
MGIGQSLGLGWAILALKKSRTPDLGTKKIILIVIDKLSGTLAN